MGFSAHDNLPPSFADFLLAEVGGKVAESVETQIWQGEYIQGSQEDQFDGVISRIKKDLVLNNVANSGSGNDVIGTDYLPDSETPTQIVGTTITSANVLDELGKVADAIDQKIYGRDDLKIYVSNNIMRAYVRALGGFGAAGLGAAGTDD